MIAVLQRPTMRPAPGSRLHSRLVLVTLGATALALSATSCSAPAVHSSPVASSSSAANGRVLAPDTADGLGLPIQAYLMTASESGELQEAQGILITKCMKSFGFSYVPQYATTRGTTDFDATNMSRRYGITDAAQASRYGYHLPPPASTSPAGAAIPAGGCMTESVRQAQQLAPAAPDAQLAQQVDLDSFSKSQSDPQVIAVTGALSKCMAGSGYDVASPLAAMGLFTGPLPAPQNEITEAKADLACKSSTKLIQTWDAVEAGIENQMISANQEAFAKILQSKQAALKAAAQLLSR